MAHNSHLQLFFLSSNRPEKEKKTCQHHHLIAMTLHAQPILCWLLSTQVTQSALAEGHTIVESHLYV